MCLCRSWWVHRQNRLTLTPSLQYLAQSPLVRRCYRWPRHVAVSCVNICWRPVLSDTAQDCSAPSTLCRCRRRFRDSCFWTSSTTFIRINTSLQHLSIIALSRTCQSARASDSDWRDLLFYVLNTMNGDGGDIDDDNNNKNNSIIILLFLMLS